MAVSQTFFIFYTILQIVQCHNLNNSKKRLSSQNLHVFAEKFKPFLYKADNNHTYIGINYFLIKTIGEHLNVGISFDFASNENRSENWKPSSE